MFVQCIVASEVIRIAGGVECSFAAIRDVLVYTVSIIGVALFFWHGQVSSRGTETRAAAMLGQQS